MLDIVSSAFDPDPEWPFLGPGDIMRFPHVLRPGSGKPSLESNDIIVCITRLPLLSTLLPDNSVLRVLLEGDVPDLVCLVLTGTDMVYVDMGGHGL